MKKHFFGTLVLISLLIVVGCDETLEPVRVDGDGEVDAAEESAEPATTEEEQDDASSEGEEVGLKLGDRVEMGDLEFEARSARWEKGSEFFEPEEGERWLVIDVEITNNSDESTTISSMLMFNMYDDQNYAVSQSYMADTRGSLDGELGSGRSMAGEIAFEVPIDSETFEFIFEPSLFGFGQAIYEINENEVLDD